MLHQLIKKIQNRLYTDRLFFIRFIAIIICLDFISFISLASINLNYFLNPLHFMHPPPIDNRPSLKMFYLSEFFLTKEPARNNEERLVEVNQRVYQKDFLKKNELFNNQKNSENIRYLIHELAMGTNNITIKRIIKQKKMVRYIWIYKQHLIIHLNYNLWKKINHNEKDLIKDSIRLSVMANFKEIKKIIWTL